MTTLPYWLSSWLTCLEVAGSIPAVGIWSTRYLYLPRLSEFILGIRDSNESLSLKVS